MDRQNSLKTTESKLICESYSMAILRMKILHASIGTIQLHFGQATGVTSFAIFQAV